MHRDVAPRPQERSGPFEAHLGEIPQSQNDPFDPTVTDAKINDYFTQAAAAAKQAHGSRCVRIYSTGNTNNDYRMIFQTTRSGRQPRGALGIRNMMATR